ncbi:hypothetical protein FACS1894219_04370 [Clostridia bacterium]|nr:hypothetical protein FACS1894219_04370 [Clostridia bacterium]
MTIKCECKEVGLEPPNVDRLCGRYIGLVVGDHFIGMREGNSGAERFLGDVIRYKHYAQEEQLGVIVGIDVGNGDRFYAVRDLKDGLSDSVKPQEITWDSISDELLCGIERNRINWEQFSAENCDERE